MESNELRRIKERDLLGLDLRIKTLENTIKKSDYRIVGLPRQVQLLKHRRDSIIMELNYV